MLLQRKTQIIVALVVSTVFIFQNCATIIRGTSQRIPITSNPTGAKIIVDGEEMGYTPLNLKLKRKENHIIRIEKQGYNPLDIRIARKTSGSLAISILGNTFLGFISLFPGFFIGGLLENWLAEPEEEPWTGMAIGAIAGAVLGWIGGIYKDVTSGAIYTLYPKELNVTLSKIEGKPQSNFIIIDAKQFQNIKWIRIKCADSDGEEIVNLD